MAHDTAVTAALSPAAAALVENASEPVRFTFPLTAVKLEESGAGEGQWTVTGSAAVFDRPSHDMGGFKFVIAQAAFTDALDADPDVHLVLNHDMRWVLARTRNGTLRMWETPATLEMWARPAPVSYADDLRVLLDRGDVDQMSFAGFIDIDEWHVDEEGEVTCTILKFSELLDVTICPQGAFPQTNVAVAASYFERAVADGRVPSGAGPSAEGATDAAVAPSQMDASAATTDDPSDSGTREFSRTARHARDEYERAIL